MFTELKKGKEYGFELEVSSQNIQLCSEQQLLTNFDITTHSAAAFQEIAKPTNIDIPLSIFREGNSGLKAIVKYLKEKKYFTFSDIAKLLNRDQRTIWTAYHQIDKQSGKRKNQNNNKNIDDKYLKELSKKSVQYINSDILKTRELSILETVTDFLLQFHTLKEISYLLNKKETTIRTVKRRADEKRKSNGKMPADKNRLNIK